MGTRKSRHNKGRKPLYKEHRRDLVDAVVDPYAPQVCRICGGPCSWNSKTLTCRPCFEALPRPKPNLGKKSPCVGPIVPDNRPAEMLVAGADRDAPYLNNHTQWKPHEESILATLLADRTNLETVAAVLGRPPERVAHRAMDRGLIVPREWRMMLPSWTPSLGRRQMREFDLFPAPPAVPRRKMRESDIFLPVPRAPRVIRPRVLVDRTPLMSFPYIRSARSSNADYLAVNRLISRGMPEDVRADIVQAMMLAVVEGTVTVGELQRNPGLIKKFVGKFRKEQTPYQEITGFGLEDDERSYEDIAATLHGEHQIDGQSEMRRAYTAIMHRASSATQIEHIYEQQIASAHRRMNEAGHNVTRREVQIILEQEGP